MLDPHAISPSPDWHRIIAAWASANAIKLAFASPTVVTDYSGGAIDGALAAGIRPTCRIEITTSAVASVYNTTDPFIITGKGYSGEDLTEKITLTQLGGGETVSGVLPFARVTGIRSPAHLLGTGSITIGTGDMAFNPPARKLRSQVAGVIPVYTSTNVLEALTLAVGDELDIVIPRIGKAAGAFPFIVFR